MMAFSVSGGKGYFYSGFYACQRPMKKYFHEHDKAFSTGHTARGVYTI